MIFTFSVIPRSAGNELEIIDWAKAMRSDFFTGSVRLLLHLDRRWQDVGLGGKNDVVSEDWPVHAEDSGHQRHVIVAPDTAVIVDDIGWNADDPKRHVNTDIFVVIRYKLDLPSLRLSFWSGR